MISTKKINKILIANRGEIACRIIKAANKLGIATVAVHSKLDTSSKFVQMAGEAILLEGTSVAETYINIEKIIAAVKKSGADAVHPGYGFLSENEKFVAELERNNVIFIGPSSDSINAMGDKISSKKLAIKAGVSVVPGFVGLIENAEQATNIIENIGLPLIIKATSGGGGKGMKIVYHESELAEAITSAQQEAEKSFGNGGVFVEKYIENPRHIEIQILGDKHGNMIHLGERECSIQRFNQKIIEESPSPFISQETRQKMCEQSIKLAKQCNYYSAGTVEYVVDQNQNFYFLEMNTRLQVEHPVTEYVTKLDLVEQMIKIAQGDKLSFTQKDIDSNRSGHAIECRICAEDPAKNFIPSIGRITSYVEPTEKYNVRVDSGIIRGSEITPYYDSMLAKLITYGDSRQEAIAQMRIALGQYHLEGITTNIGLLEDIMRNEDFIYGSFSTAFIKTHYPKGFKGAVFSDEAVRNIVFASTIANYIKEQSLTCRDHRPILDTLTNVDRNAFAVQIDDEIHNLEVKTCVNNIFTISYNTGGQDTTYYIESDYLSGSKVIGFTIIDENQALEQTFAMRIQVVDATKFLISHGGISKIVAIYPNRCANLLKYMPKSNKSAVQNHITAPISGLVIRVKVASGDAVVEGQDLLAIEAMKMENAIKAEFGGIVKSVEIKEGQVVSGGAILVTFEEQKKQE